MASSLFSNLQRKNQPSRNLNDLINLANEIKAKGPEALFNEMYQYNPEFKKFIDNNKGKTPEQIALENNIRI